MNIIDAYKLIEEEKLEEAYEALSNIIDDKKQGIDARYTRAMLDMFNIRKNLETTIDDLHYLINKKSKYHDVAYSFLTLIYDDLDENDKVIKYGKLAFKFNTPFKNEVALVLSRALATTGKKGNLEDALVIINTCLENIEDSNLELLECKVDILIALNMFEEAEKSIDQMVIDFGHSGSTYHYKAKLALKHYNVLNDEDSLLSCISNATISLQYDNEDYKTKLILIDAYCSNKEYDKAIEVIETLKSDDDDNEEEIITQKIKVYQLSNQYQKGLDYIDENIEKFPNTWRFRYLKGMFLHEIDNANVLETIKYFKEAYKLSPTSGILIDIHYLNMGINNELDTYNFIKENYEIAEDKGFTNFILAECGLRLNFDYDIISEYHFEALKNGFLNYFEYIDSICNYTKDRSQCNKTIKKIEKEALESNFAWSRRKVAIRYLYKEDGYKQNLKKAKSIIEGCMKHFGDDACTLSLYGICLFMLKQYDLAYQYVLKSYDILKELKNPECYCGYGYLAYFKLLGYGTKIDIEGAKNLILETVAKEPIYTCSHIAFLYCYFFLDGDSRFSGEHALKMLETNYPFYRYDISRIVFLNQVCKKLKIESEKYNELLNHLNVYTKEELKYYKENIDKDISLPFWKNV